MLDCGFYIYQCIFSQWNIVRVTFKLWFISIWKNIGKFFSARFSITLSSVFFVFVCFCFFIAIYFFQFFEIFYALLAASCWMPAGTKSGVNFNWHGSLQFPHILSYPVSDLSWPLPVLIQIHRRSSTAASTQISRGGRPAISRNFCLEQFQIHLGIYFFVDTNFFFVKLPAFTTSGILLQSSAVSNTSNHSNFWAPLYENKSWKFVRNQLPLKSLDK